MDKINNKKLKEIEKFFEENKISAMLKVPGKGTFSIYQSTADKLDLLELAEIEIGIRDKIKEAEITDRVTEIMKHSKPTKQGILSYVG